MTPTELSTAAGLSVPYASQIINGNRSPSRDVAYRIFETTGEKFGHLRGLSDDQVSTLREIELAEYKPQGAAAA